MEVTLVTLVTQVRHRLTVHACTGTSILKMDQSISLWCQDCESMSVWEGRGCRSHPMHFFLQWYTWRVPDKKGAKTCFELARNLTWKVNEELLFIASIPVAAEFRQHAAWYKARKLTTAEDYGTSTQYALLRVVVADTRGLIRRVRNRHDGAGRFSSLLSPSKHCKHRTVQDRYSGQNHGMADGEGCRKSVVAPSCRSRSEPNFYSR